MNWRILVLLGAFGAVLASCGDDSPSAGDSCEPGTHHCMSQGRGDYLYCRGERWAWGSKECFCPDEKRLVCF